MKSRILKIKLLALDVDGVLTDGKIIYDSDGREIKQFDVQDGFGMVLFQKAGFKTAIITARDSKVVEVRAKDLRVDGLYQNAYPKLQAYRQLLKDFRLKDEEICFVGDDLVDISILKRVGFAVGVPNCAPEVRKFVHHITRKKGGNGAVRETIELILKTQGKWSKIRSEIENV